MILSAPCKTVCEIGVQSATNRGLARFHDTGANTGPRNPNNIKIGITNTTWLHVVYDSLAGFSGIQIK